MPDPTPPKVWRESSADGEDDDDLDDLDGELSSMKITSAYT